MEPQAREDANSALKVFSVNGVKGVLGKLGDAFRAESGTNVGFTFGTIGALQAKMAADDIPDVLIAMAAAMAKAEDDGPIEKGASVEVSRTGLAAAVKAGGLLPDVSTLERFRDVLLNIRSLSYTDPQTGAASGIAFANILEQMGIADQVKDKTILVAGGPVGEAVAEGRVELGIQQMTELLPVNSISMLGSLPAEYQRMTVYQAGAPRKTIKPQSAAKFVNFVTSPKTRQAFADAGFGPF